MCGFAGFYTSSKISFDQRQTHLVRMSNSLAHRGPDGEGFWIDEHSGIALSHRRLAIIDLSPYGQQPMSSPSKRYIMVFNGEIYNYQTLKKEIDDFPQEVPISWKGNSDTEVMLAAFDIWGIKKAVEKLNGMFAFAVWDLKEQNLYLGRDRIGEKPLYYGWCGDSFLFGSELKSLKAHPSFDPTLNPQAIDAFLKYNYIPTPSSIYKSIYKLTPGTLVCLNSKHFQEKSIPSPFAYWSLQEIALQGVHQPTTFSETEAIEHLDILLNKSVQQQMVADVPLGAFLSGGIDSSLIVSLMQHQSSLPIKTFTIGFQQADMNEAAYARSIASYLKTDHTEMLVSDQQAREVIPLLSSLYDEPFADSSQIPTYLVSRLARQHVTVSLSGDAGDELFGGYNRHIWANQLEFYTSKIPLGMRNLLGLTLQKLPLSFMDRLSAWEASVFTKRRLPSSLGDKVKKFSNVLLEQKSGIYETLISNSQDTENLLSADYKNQTLFSNKNYGEEIDNLAQKMMLNDSLTYLPDDILVKVDRAAMGVGLETRVPMLDKDIIEFSWKLPLSMKIKQGKGKWILRQVLSRYIPPKMMERPKQGFAVPLSSWLRGPLFNWADSFLNEQAVKNSGILNAHTVQQKWSEHVSGKKNCQHQLWALLMLQIWLKNNH